MKIIVIDHNSIKKYILLDPKDTPVIPVIKYLKYLSNIGRTENTLKSYAYHLKLYFEFLEEKKIDYQEINLQTLADFIGWLRSPFQTLNVVPLEAQNSKRSEKTINIIMTCVLGLYDFLERNEQNTNLINKSIAQKKIPAKYKSYKPFLHHLSKNSLINKSILKLKETKKPAKTLHNYEITSLYNSCVNTRDQLLLRILYEGGLRIGEAVNIWIEDININEHSIRVRKSKTIAGEGRIVFVSQDTINLFQDYLIDYHIGGIDTNYLFYNLTGKNRGKPFTVQGMYSLVKRLRKKTNIYFTPHMFRHTYATELYENGVDIGVIQKLLGHAHVQTTMQVYMHPSNKSLRESYDKAQKEISTRRGTINESEKK